MSKELAEKYLDKIEELVDHVINVDPLDFMAAVRAIKALIIEYKSGK